MTTKVADLRRWQAERPLLLADGVGTGPVPLELDADIVVLDPAPAANLTEQVRARIEVSRTLTPQIIEAVEDYDPEGSAAWWVSPVNPNEPLLGRPVFGGRPSWQIDLEDKLALDPILEAVGAPRAPDRDGACVVRRTDGGVRQGCRRSRLGQRSSGPVTIARASTAAATTSVSSATTMQAREAAASSPSTATRSGSRRCSKACPAASTRWCCPMASLCFRPVELINLRNDRDRHVLLRRDGYDVGSPAADDTAMMRELARRRRGVTSRRPTGCAARSGSMACSLPTDSGSPR